MEISYKPSFLRQLNKLSPLLQEEAFEKIALFKNIANHPKLKVHKLHGELRDCFSFSVNYRYRIVFRWEIKNKSAVLLAIGDHSVYE